MVAPTLALAMAMTVSTSALATLPYPSASRSSRMRTCRECSASLSPSSGAVDEDADPYSALFTPVAGAVMGRTENGAATFTASGSACLDLFFDTVPGIGEARLKALLGSAWAEDATTTLRLIFQLGDPRRGKGDKRNFYASMLWLLQHHPETFFQNLPLVPRHSYYKTLLDLMQAYAEGLPSVLDDQRKMGLYEGYGSIPISERPERRQQHHERKVRQYLDSGLAPPTMTDYSISPGVMVRFVSGKYSGQRGIVKKLTAKMAYVVLSTMVEHTYHHEYSDYEIEMFREVFGEDLEWTRTGRTHSELRESIVRVDKNSVEVIEEVADLYRLRVKIEHPRHDWRTHQWATEESRLGFGNYVLEQQREESRAARVLRKERNAARKANARSLYAGDATFARFYDATAEVFADALRDDQIRVEAGNHIGGLPAKWAPTPRGAHDRATGIVDGIVERLYPAAEHKLADGTHAEYLSFMGNRYRKLLSAQRAAAQVPEHFTGSGDWHLTNYSRMASTCRFVSGEMYRKHDEERYTQFLVECEQEALLPPEERSGKGKRVSAGALLPHKLVERAVEAGARDDDKKGPSEVDLQWLRLVEDTKAAGQLPSALAVCDVSGSMSAEMDVAVALSLLLADVADEPWRNKICTFSMRPKFVTMPSATTDNLAERVALVKGLQWGMNTDFQAVFDELLSFASGTDLKPDDMVKTLFVFSDMEFDCATARPWSTDLEVIKDKFQRAGYPVPEIVFWNLRSTASRPTTHSEPGVAMLSGFGAGLMKAFLEYRLEDFEMAPLAQMLAALAPYAELSVAAPDLPHQPSADAA